MIFKRHRTAFWDDNGPAARILNLYSRGIETEQLQKIAADESLKFEDIKPEKGFAFIHVVTAGAGEFFSANANGDHFNGDFLTVKFPEGMQKTADLDGGLKKYHRTYRQFGAVYRDHHNSKSGASPEGQIVWEGYNEPMHRGEVVIKIAEDKWNPELQKLASGEPLYFSIGAGIERDLCSICSNAAKKRNEYCEHLQFQKLAIHPSGQQVYAYNDKPHFHDISLVGKPADRIAFGLSKIASEIELVDEYIAHENIYAPASLIKILNGEKEQDRYSLLQKLAEMEKEIECMTSGDNEDLCESCSLNSDEEDKVVKELKGEDFEKVISSLINNKSMLTPNTFVRIVIGKSPEDVDGVQGFPTALKSIFNTILNSGDLSDVLDDSAYMKGMKYPDRQIENKVKGLSDLISLEPEPVKHRIIKITVIGGKKLDKKASADEPSEKAKYLAREYAKYQISFLAACKDINPTVAVLYNKSA